MLYCLYLIHQQHLTLLTMISCCVDYPYHSAKSIVCSLVCCWLHYANSTIIGISGSNISCLQRIQNTLALITTHQWGRIGISQTLWALDWQPVKWFINYLITTLTYKLLESGEPSYLRSRITDRIFQRMLRSIISRQPATRTMYLSYEYWIVSISLCCSSNLELPEVRC